MEYARRRGTSAMLNRRTSRRLVHPTQARGAVVVLPPVDTLNTEDQESMTSSDIIASNPIAPDLANLLSCIGYTQERIHSGLMKLVGVAGSLVRQAFFSTLGLPDPGVCRWDFEKHKIDLVLTRSDGQTWGVEFKVDGNPTRGQLEEYADSVDQLFFVTLGMAEDMITFSMPKKTLHVSLDKWCDAVASARRAASGGLAEILKSYEQMYGQELLHRRNVGRNSLDKPRHAFGRIRLLGWLARQARPSIERLGLGHEVKTYGVQGDVTLTIWDARQGRDGFYLEVNTSGKLSLKGNAHMATSRVVLQDALKACQGLVPFEQRYDGRWSRRGGQYTKTMTLGAWGLGDLWSRLLTQDGTVVVELEQRIERFSNHVLPLL
jgi:hypothetical protein